MSERRPAGEGAPVLSLLDILLRVIMCDTFYKAKYRLLLL